MYIVLAIIIVFLIPIPLSIKIVYENKNFAVYVYSFKLDIKKNKEKKIKKKKYKKEEKPQHYNLVELINALSENPLKINTNISINFTYGTDDAAVTAITYGFIWALYPALQYIFNKFLKLKKLDYKINPDFDNEKINLILKIKFLFNFIIVIFNIFYVIKSLKKSTLKK